MAKSQIPACENVHLWIKKFPVSSFFSPVPRRRTAKPFGFGLYWEKAAYEEAEHAAKFAELLGEVVTDSTKKNLAWRVDCEFGATQGKTDLAGCAKKNGLDAIHDTVHEMARDKLHDIDLNAPKEEREKLPDQRTREVQAESVAYTVCQHYGLDTSDYSFGYVAGWSTGREMEELKSSLETIRSTAAEIINGIDAQITELQKDQEQEQEAVYRLDSGEYLHVQASEAGYDYTLYDKNYQALDGGQLDNPDLPLTAARDEILALQDRKSAETQAVKIADFEKGKEAAEQDTFTIYQLKREDATRDYRFEPYDRLQAAGLAVDPAHYEPVYSGPMTPGMTLENIYTRFNIDHPQDFKGHSLSVSDVVVVQQGGQSTAHYVDSFGYKTVPEFLQPENYLKVAEQSTEQNYNMIDGMVNNTPTVGELEAKAKAGEVISLTDLATAIQAEKGRGREEKPSIRAQLKQYKEQTADRKKAAKTKSHQMDV